MFKVLLVKLMTTAAGFTGLNAPAQPPAVQFVHPETICLMAASNCKAERRAIALYREDNNTIYLSQKWSRFSAYDRSVLFHELVHYLQDMNGKRMADCGIERQAYMAERRFVREVLDKNPDDFELDLVTIAAYTACRPVYERGS